MLKTVVITNKKVEDVTKGLRPLYSRNLASLSLKQIPVICSYISAVESEMKLSSSYKESILNTLITLSKHVPGKRFKDFTREDLLRYLNHFRKDDKTDPSHRWIGTYNLSLVHIIRFFRWLYSPDLAPPERPTPKVMQNLQRLRRREVSSYSPADMWSPEDNLLFLKYCPSSRDKCYHSMTVDTGARPHELLKLKIKDVEFKEEDGSRYAKIVVNGKTGERSLALVDSIPYLTQWISIHPQGTNREAILLPNQPTGQMIRVEAMLKAYKNYKKYFTSLLTSKTVPEEDKKKITELLRKRWNPYVHRHSAITEKSGLLSSDSKLRQFAGWTSRSQMHHKYVHFNGGESMKDILTKKGIIKEDKVVNILAPKICPSCREPNKPDSQFCHKCTFVMSFEAYHKGIEEREKKDQEIRALREQTQIMSKQLATVIDQQQQNANTFDMKFVKLLEIVKTGLTDQDEATRSFIRGEILKMMPRKLTTKELQKIEALRNLTGVFTDISPDDD